MNKHINTISILGYGWLGAPLAQELSAQGYSIKASTTTAEKLGSIRQAGLQPYKLSLSPDLECDAPDFFDTDLLIINFPPKRRPDIIDFHTAQIQNLITAILRHNIPNIIYISSTSVYPSLQNTVTEDDTTPPDKDSGKALRIAEELLAALPNQKTTFIRFAGLVGGDRLPGRFLAGKTDIPDAQSPVNLIHRDDCIGIISTVIEQNVFGEIFNACMDEHPTRKEFYEAAAAKAGLPLPLFAPQTQLSYKIIDSSKLKKMTGYQMRYTNPMDIL